MADSNESELYRDGVAWASAERNAINVNNYIWGDKFGRPHARRLRTDAEYREFHSGAQSVLNPQTTKLRPLRERFIAGMARLIPSRTQKFAC